MPNPVEHYVELTEKLMDAKSFSEMSSRERMTMLNELDTIWYHMGTDEKFDAEARVRELFSARSER